MAILFIDGFDYFTDQQSADLVGRWSPSGTDSGFTRETSTRNSHGAALGMLGSREISKAFSSVQTIHIAFAFKWTGTIGSNTAIMEIQEGGTTQIEVQVTNAGQFRILRGTFTQIGIGSFTMSSDTWYHIAIKLFVDSTTGTFELRIDGSGTPDINLTSTDTDSNNSQLVDSLTLIGSNSGFQWDDFVLADDTGSQAFLGDHDVYTILPDGAGAASDFTASPAVANYLNVDEATPDGDTTYNESSTLNDKDRHTFGDVPTNTDTVYAVQVGAFAKKDSVGARDLRVVAFDGTTEGQGADNALGAGSYRWVTEVFEDHPTDANPWTETEVNGMQAGYEIV
jgi:hypothetical protein